MIHNSLESGRRVEPAPEGAQEILLFTYKGEANVSVVHQSVDVAPNPLARALSSLPEVWQSLLIEHEPDEYGRCRICRSSGTPGVRWPCTLRVAAEDARDIAGDVARQQPDVPDPRGGTS
jgi:hypothetical protein